MKGDVLSKYIDMIDPNIELTAVDQAYHAILYGKYDLHVQKPGHSEALSVLDATEGSCILEQWSAEAAEAQKNSAPVAKRKANLITVTPPGTPHPASDAMDTAEDATTVAVEGKKPVQQTLSIYLDNAATTRVDDTVAHAMTEYLLAPLSLTRNKNIIQEARETVASAISANPTDILFTSGGTESNNWAIQGAIMQAKAEASAPRRYHLVTTSVEHEAVLAVMHHLVEYYDDVDLTILPVDFQGVLLEDTLRKLLDKRSQDTVLVSVMHANNEVGTVQNIHALATVCKSYNTGILFHTDACQSIGKVPAIVGDNIDLMTLNAHKLHGPKGVGALYVRDQSTISPLFAGRADGQEEGELNTVGILGFSVAIATNCNLTDSKRVSPQIAEVSRIRNLLFKTLQTVFPAAYVHGPALPENDTDISTLSFINRLPNNISVCFGDIKPTAEEVGEFQVKPDKTIKYEGEQAVTFLSSQGVSCSTASACSSNRTDQFNKISHVLKALKLSRAQAIGSLRFSTSKYTKESDVTTDLLPVLQAFRRSLLVSLSS
jgi:cysteine desulfurase